MLRTITPSEMRRVETCAIARGLTTGEALMQRAAAHVARAAARHLAGKRRGTVVCICGLGGNGGDGLAAMRILAEGDEAFTGECWLLPGTGSEDYQREFNRLEKQNRHVVSPVELRLLDENADLPAFPADTSCIVDAMFGTGLSRPLTGMTALLCRSVSAAYERGVPVLAVDIPSGLDGETGCVLGAAVHATETLAFHRPKLGLYLGRGPDYAGQVTVCGIELPSLCDDADGLWILERGERLLPPRRRVSHKGSYGRVLLVVGRRGMAGAAAISALAALRAGAGLVTVACPDAIVDIVQMLCPCATCVPLPEDSTAAYGALSDALCAADAVGIGCGLGTSSFSAELLPLILKSLAERNTPTVLDADALNIIASQSNGGFSGCPALFMTPHPGEAARLLNCPLTDILQDARDAARRISERYDCGVILKGACSVLCAGADIALNPFGTPAMAKGGSGDALTGVLTALLAERAAGAYIMNDLRLMQTACALHGLAGEMAERHFGERGMLATDLCACLGITEREQMSSPVSDEINQVSRAVSPLGRTVAVTVDRPLGTRHPEHQDTVYQLNYGYVQDVLAADNEWQDAYLYGVKTPVEWFEGEVIAVIHRLNDVEDKWVVAAPGTHATLTQIAAAVDFQERFFEIHIEM